MSVAGLPSTQPCNTRRDACHQEPGPQFDVAALREERQWRQDVLRLLRESEKRKEAHEKAVARDLRELRRELGELARSVASIERAAEHAKQR